MSGQHLSFAQRSTHRSRRSASMPVLISRSCCCRC